ncbi:MAG: DUF4440 domain-containing protein [Candidatus Berkiella sp.]
MNQHIYELELSLLDPAVRKSAVKINQLIADAFVEFGSSGKIYHKNELLEELPLEEPQIYKVQNFSTSELAEDVVLATYLVEIDGARSLRSSIWKYNGDTWQMIFHQGTKCEDRLK